MQLSHHLNYSWQAKQLKVTRGHIKDTNLTWQYECAVKVTIKAPASVIICQVNGFPPSVWDHFRFWSATHLVLSPVVCCTLAYSGSGVSTFQLHTRPITCGINLLAQFANSQCWPNLTHMGVTKPLWVKRTYFIDALKQNRCIVWTFWNAAIIVNLHIVSMISKRPVA